MLHLRQATVEVIDRLAQAIFELSGRLPPQPLARETDIGSPSLGVVTGKGRNSMRDLDWSAE